MKTKKLLRSNAYALSALLFLFGIVGGNLLLGVRHASAAQITDRSLTLEAGADPIINGGSKAGASGVKHLFQFSLTPNSDIGSVLFQYCTLPFGPNVSCNTPQGLNTTTATLSNETGATGFTIDATTNGAPFLHRTHASIGDPNSGSPVPVSYELDNITNPDGTSCGATSPQNQNCTFFVWISTFTSEDTTGSALDTGTVTASTAQQITLTGTMPESLVFCTGGTIDLTSGVPDCAKASDGAITFNKLFSPTDTSTTSSQMAASTNAGSGYAITVNGPTLTSGSNTVTAMDTNDFSIHGKSQFGLNLKLNTTASSNPIVGSEVAPAANGTNYRGEAHHNGTQIYDTVDKFEYNTGDVVADSANGGAGGTDAQIFTVSYIVNVPGSQPAGTYTTTLTYICTPTF